MALLDHLATWSADDLSHLMRKRPDLLPASDRGLEAVARKAGTAMSIGRALVGADVGMLVVAEALMAKPPATVADIDGILGTKDPIGVADAVERLRRTGVVIVDDGVIFPVGALGDLLHRPLGLGPSFVELADHLPADTIDRLAAALRAEGSDRRSATIRAIGHRLLDPQTLEVLLRDAPEHSRELLNQLISKRSPAVPLPTGYPYRGLESDDPLAWLLASGFVAAVTETGAELAREVVIAATPDGLAPTAALRPIPLLPVDGLSPDLIGGEAADRSNLLLEGAETLLRLIDQEQVSVRKAGGIGPRELKRLAKVCGLEIIEVTRLFELLLIARLVTLNGSRLTTSDLSGRWWTMSRHRRYLALVRAWLAADRFLSRGLADNEESKVVALGDAEPVAAVAAGRAATLQIIADVADGQAFDQDQLAAAVVWRGPNLWGTGEPPAEVLVDWTVAEAELLGLVAAAAPAPVLRALMAEDEVRLIETAGQALSDDQDRFVLQSDLTAVAFGPLAPTISRSLGDMTERVGGLAEGRGLGHRFTETSIRRAFDRGWTAQSIEAFLTEHGLAGVPQPLQYLLADVARRYGAIRVQPAQSVIITADDISAVELGSNRKASSLGLRLIAPTVMTSPLDPVTVTEALRELGLFPVLEGSSVTIDKPRTDDQDDTADGGDAHGLAGLPADWTGPPLPAGPFPDEITDAVDALISERHDGGQVPDEPSRADNADPPHGRSHPRSRPTEDHRAPEAGEPNTIERRLRGFWGRATIIDVVIDGAPQRIRGTLVATGKTVALLTPAGVIDVPGGSVLAVDDPLSG